MKILVIQIARLGDILMTWPALRALRRAQPDADIHFLVRPRFESATAGLDAVSRVRVLPTEEMLRPLVQAEPDDAAAVQRMGDFLSELREERYDEVVNLSFSPLSSWITKAATVEGTRVRGYTRHIDGWLNISDGVASYFYAQVGPHRPNRIHLSDLFAAQMEVDLAPEDWSPPRLPAVDFGLPAERIVIHPGASESGKQVPAFLWGRALKRLHELKPDLTFVVVGSREETVLAEEIRANAGGISLIDLTGRTRFEELFSVISGARLLIGADSAPMHVAALTGTPCFNVSVGDVNFWETGPKSAGSVVLRLGQAADFSSENVAHAVVDALAGRASRGLFSASAGMPSFTGEGIEIGGFAWDLTAALYLEAPYPIADDANFLLAMSKMIEMNKVVLEQLSALPDDSDQLGPLMDRVDEVLRAIGQMVPAADVLVRWVMTEKLKIPPGSKGEIKTAMLSVHRHLGQALRPYDLEAFEREA